MLIVFFLIIIHTIEYFFIYSVYILYILLDYQTSHIQNNWF